MIREVSGDILLSRAQAIAHGVAPHDDFKQGLALALREQWPGMYKDFRHYCQTYNPKPGTLWSWKGPGSPVIINLFTQEPAEDHRGRPGKATIQNVHHALQALKKELVVHSVGSLALPRLATGVGGLSWDHVKPLIEEALKEAGIPVYVYTTYRKGVAASEGV
ncbi:MAG TPA: macro domain-containing protein [Nitrospira sp.]|nr:macro domain-containing protein [Nitrospira sp.]